MSRPLVTGVAPSSFFTRALLLLLGLAPAGLLRGVDTRPNILFCIADDWSYGHSGADGDRTVSTPAFDRIAREGIRFTHAFSAAPSCTASRAAILTGQYPHRLETGANLWGSLPHEFKVYPDLLEAAGYVVGLASKGWGPGDFQAGGFTRNPAGPRFKNFEEFHRNLPAEKPFCFWLGSTDPHRAYVKGSGLKSGLKPENVVVPPYWPNTPEVRNDILDYYFAVQRFDTEVAKALQILESAGQLDNTLVVITGDNGWPFPRCKANLYDGGTRQPLAVRWPAKIKAGAARREFVNLADLAPTFLEAAGLTPPAEMTGRSLIGVFAGTEKAGARDKVFLERERHANVRAGELGYPMRAVRTREFLYIWNPRPDRWPAGDPEAKADPTRKFGDVDEGPTKAFILAHRDEPAFKEFFTLSFSKRPSEELYDVARDPHQLHNLAAEPAFLATKQKLHTTLRQWMKETADPRGVGPADDGFDHYRFGGRQSEGGKQP
jgi:N-sulfoglucosamine sulfohydrolase